MRPLQIRFVHLIRSIGWPSRGTGALLGIAVLMVGVLQTPASAATANPYGSGNKGYDVSYPNCSATAPIDYFAIVGLGGGRPFTKNSCAAAEWSAAQSPATALTPSFYFNTGYAGAYAKSVDAFCSSLSQSTAVSGVFGKLAGHQLTQAEQAWAIGCSEFDFAYNYAVSFNAAPSATSLTPPPTMWWADIETGNSWSANVSLNQFTLDGMSSEMASYGVNGYGYGGFYSSSKMWASITGNSSWTTQPPATANWVAGGSCTSISSPFDSSGITPVPMWLSQGVASNTIDTDTAC